MTPGHGVIRLRYEQSCETDGCVKPAHIGGLCSACFFAATPARRAVELGAEDNALAVLEALWTLPTREAA